MKTTGVKIMSAKQRSQ